MYVLGCLSCHSNSVQARKLMCPGGIGDSVHWFVLVTLVKIIEGSIGTANKDGVFLQL